MSILDWIYSKKDEDESLTMRFDKKDNSWHVMKGMEILYFGTQEECKEFVNLNQN